MRALCSFVLGCLGGEDEALQPCRGGKACSRCIGEEKETKGNQVDCTVHEADVMRTYSL